MKLNKNHKASAAITELPVCHALHKSAMARQRANVLRQWELNPRYSAIQTSSRYMINTYL